MLSENILHKIINKFIIRLINTLTEAQRFDTFGWSFSLKSSCWTYRATCSRRRWECPFPEVTLHCHQNRSLQR